MEVHEKQWLLAGKIGTHKVSRTRIAEANVIHITDVNGLTKSIIICDDGIRKEATPTGWISLPNWPEDLNALTPIEEKVLRTDAEKYIHLLKCERGEHWGFASASERFEALYQILCMEGYV